MTDERTPRGRPPERFEDDLAALSRLLEGDDLAAPAGIAPRAPGTPVPMSFAQELLWLLDRATPGLAAYNLPMVRRLRGPLDHDALDQALTALQARHELMRARFTDREGTNLLLVDPPAPMSARVVDLDGLPAEQREAEARRIVRERSRAPFDLSNEHMFRATLIRLADDDHILILESHHIVMDGWSLGIVWRDLAKAYAGAQHGGRATLPPPPVQFGDFSIRQRERLKGDHLAMLLEFWREQLGDATEPLDLPTDHRRPVTPGFEGARQTRTLPRERLAALKRFAQEKEVTLYMLLLAAYGLVLHRYSGRDRVLIGSGSAGRTLPETEDIVGYLNNTLVQRVDCTGDPTVNTLLARVKDSALGAYDHQEVPLEKLVLELRDGQERLATAPLFEVVLTMQDVMGPAPALAGLAVEPFGVEVGLTKFDITLFPAETTDGLRLTAQYRAELFEPTTMTRFLAHLDAALEGMVRDPSRRISDLSILSEDERALTSGSNTTAVFEGPPTTVVALFEAQADRVPTRAAVVAPEGDEGTSPAVLSYSDLNQRANRLAHHLRSLGVTPNQPVGLLLERSGNALTGLMGILKAGGAYVPLAADAPQERISAQLVEGGVHVVVTVADLAGRLPPGARVVVLDRDAAMLDILPATNPEPTTLPDSLAYVLYTSGSTGVPKGVAVTHANIVHYARAVSRVLASMSADQTGDGFAVLDGLHLAMVSTLAADLGNTCLYPALLAGATLHLLGKDVAMEPAAFAEYLERHRIDVLKITPSHLRAIIAGRSTDELPSVLPRRWLVLGGEALPIDLARSLAAAGTCRVLNHYGPTETTVGVCTFEPAAHPHGWEGSATVPIGFPLANTRAYVLDRAGVETPIGIPGELFIGGDGITRGYLNRSDLTAERFVPEPRAATPDARMYRTGDRVRRLGSGALEFLGRMDDQVKVRGFRVEPGEIETLLARQEGVRAAAVIALPDGGADLRLVAYVVTDPGLTDQALATALARHVSAYMIPSTWVHLDSLPLNANGKVDRRALPAPDTAEAPEQSEAPRNELEASLAALWSEVLKRERVGRDQNFFALGGHSLLAIRLLGRIAKQFGVRLALRNLFDNPSVAALAPLVGASQRNGGMTPGAFGAITRRDRTAIDPPAPTSTQEKGS